MSSLFTIATKWDLCLHYHQMSPRLPTNYNWNTYTSDDFVFFFLGGCAGGASSRLLWLLSLFRLPPLTSPPPLPPPPLAALSVLPPLSKGGMKMFPVNDDSELLVCLPGNLAFVLFVGGIVVPIDSSSVSLLSVDSVMLLIFSLSSLFDINFCNSRLTLCTSSFDWNKRSDEWTVVDELAWVEIKLWMELDRDLWKDSLVKERWFLC